MNIDLKAKRLEREQSLKKAHEAVTRAKAALVEAEANVQQQAGALAQLDLLIAEEKAAEAASAGEDGTGDEEEA